MKMIKLKSNINFKILVGFFILIKVVLNSKTLVKKFFNYYLIVIELVKIIFN